MREKSVNIIGKTGYNLLSWKNNILTTVKIKTETSVLTITRTGVRV